MHRLVLPAVGLLCALGPFRPASAEDFTGFYAGVNAGHALGRARGADGRASAAAPGAGWSGPDARALPPSALNAARAMRGGRAVSGPDATPLPR